MDKILDKVKKMMALANDAGASEGERENALRMAHNLLAKHNLAMADLSEHEALEGRDNIHLDTYGMKWCRQVAKYTGRLFFCEHFYSLKLNGTKIRHHFVGKQSNAVTASLMTEYLINSILKECRKNWKHNLAPESRAFAHGAADQLMNRVFAMMKNPAGKGISDSTAMVVVEMYKTEQDANRAWMKNGGIELVTVKSRTKAVEAGAYNAGREYANGLSLNGQVANKNQLRIGS